MPKMLEVPERDHSSWTEWSKHVLNELERLDITSHNTDDKMRDLEKNQVEFSGTVGGGTRCQEHGEKLDKINNQLIRLIEKVGSEVDGCEKNAVIIDTLKTDLVKLTVEMTQEMDRCKKNTIIISDIKTDVATLKVKSGVWGAAGASIPIIIGVIIWVLTK